MRAPVLQLPGDRPRGSFRPSRALVAALAGLAWLPVQATALPALGLGPLPLDPLLPVVAAFALGGRSHEALLLAVILGLGADGFAGVATPRHVLQYVAVVALAGPLHGRVVLRDRLVPVIGVGTVALLAGAASLLLLLLLGAASTLDLRALPREAFGTSVAAWVLWPALRLVAGWEEPGSRGR